MRVNFAAVHNRNPWRKHSNHRKLDAAINGNDGAKNLLLRKGRVADLWTKHGNVQCVFVWEDGAPSGQAFRLNPDPAGSVQATTLTTDRILAFHRRGGCSTKEIAACFEHRRI